MSVPAVLTLLACAHPIWTSKGEIVKAWDDATWGSFFPMDPICEKTPSAASRRLAKAYEQLERLSGRARELYPRSEPFTESYAVADCPDAEHLPDVGTPAYTKESQRAALRAARVEGLNAKLAEALGEAG